MRAVDTIREDTAPLTKADITRMLVPETITRREIKPRLDKFTSIGFVAQSIFGCDRAQMQI